MSAAQRLKLLRQRILAAFRIGGEVDGRLEETPDGLFVRVDGRRVAVLSPLRWKLYRKGWRARLDRLEREYGVGRHVNLTPESMVIDVGANAGEFAHVCARCGSMAYCFEPDPVVFACLQTNIAAIEKARAFDAVIWKDDGDIDFALAPDRADSSVFADGPRTKWRAVTIASFARESALSRIGFIKCDAEGAEPEVLEGVGEACADVLRRNGFSVIDPADGDPARGFARDLP